MRNPVTIAAALAVALLLDGCTSVGRVGLLTRGSADPGGLLKGQRHFHEVGPAEARSCRFLALGLIPAGNGDIQAAADKALAKSGGDALINVTTANSLYGFIPVYNVLSVGCTTVKGTAIAFND
ncbi:MAG: hypothetical protein HY927_04125 [Elusimicrobia bacterium]|nr:hypothetical protein [Elusimicrobiota bacterium]